MWCFFRTGFISAVQDRSDPSRLVVRSRRPEILKELFPSFPLVMSAGSDYQCRVFIPRAELSRVMLQAIEEIKYDNFKASLEDPELAALYDKVWSLGLAYQK